VTYTQARRCVTKGKLQKTIAKHCLVELPLSEKCSVNCTTDSNVHL